MRKRNIVYYVTRQYMKQNKKRTATTFFGIAFMALLMTCVFVGKDTGLGYLEQAAALKEGNWHAAFYDISGEKREEIQNLPYVKETAVSEQRCIYALFHSIHFCLSMRHTPLV